MYRDKAGLFDIPHVVLGASFLLHSMKYDYDKLLYNYIERIGICYEDSRGSMFDAEKIARKQLIDDLVATGMQRFEAVYEAKKIIDSSGGV